MTGLEDAAIADKDMRVPPSTTRIMPLAESTLRFASRNRVRW